MPQLPIGSNPSLQRKAEWTELGRPSDSTWFTRAFTVIIGLCITDATFGAAFLFSGVLRYPLVHDISLSGIPLVSRSDCTKRFFVQLLTICYQMQGILSFIVALDRLLAVIFPVKYLKFGNFYNVLIIAAPCVIVLIPTVVNLVLTLNDDSPVSALCLTKEALNPGFHDYMLLMRIISCIGSGMVYGYIALRLKQHFAKHGIQVMGNVKVETNQLRNIRHSTITVGLTTINALVFLLIPDLLALFDLGGFYDNYPTILYSFYCINVNVNFFILVTRHKEIRQNFAYFVQVLLLRQQAGKANQPSNTTRIGGVSNMMKRSCTPAVA